MSKRDYYEVLGVERTAAEVQIKSAYRKLALKFHPDRNPGDSSAEERFKEAAEAYAVLADQEKRALYDRFGHQGVSTQGSGFDPTVFADFGDILGGLGDIFGFGDLFGRRSGGPHRGADLRYDLEIDFVDSAKGADTTIQIPRLETCETCHGSGAAAGTTPTPCQQCGGRGQVGYQQGFFTVARTCPRCQGVGRVIAKPCATCRGAGRTQAQRKLTVKIPAGIATGQRLRLHREGEHGGADGPPGDLYVVVHVKDDPVFRRDGNDLGCVVPVNFTTLALGGEIHVPTLDAQENVRIPEGTQTGAVFRLRGKGMPDVSGRGRGDLYVTVEVVTPRKLTKEQRSIVEQLAKALPKEQFEPREQASERDDKNIFDRVKDIFG